MIKLIGRLFLSFAILFLPVAVSVVPMWGLAQSDASSPLSGASQDVRSLPAGSATADQLNSGYVTPSASKVNGSSQVNTSNAPGTVQNPLVASSFCGLFVSIYKGLLALGISIGVLFIVFSGFKFVMAQGNPEKISDARKTFVNTIIGIGIYLAAMLIAQIVANTVNQLMNGSGTPNIMSCK